MKLGVVWYYHELIHVLFRYHRGNGFLLLRQQIVVLEHPFMVWVFPV